MAFGLVKLHFSALLFWDNPVLGRSGEQADPVFNTTVDMRLMLTFRPTLFSHVTLLLKFTPWTHVVWVKVLHSSFVKKNMCISM